MLSTVEFNFLFYITGILSIVLTTSKDIYSILVTQRFMIKTARGEFMELPYDAPENLHKTHEGLLKESEHFDLDNISLEFKKRCVQFMIDLLDFIINNYSEIDIVDYSDFMVSYKNLYEGPQEDETGICFATHSGLAAVDCYLEAGEITDLKSVKKLRNEFSELLK